MSDPVRRLLSYYGDFVVTGNEMWGYVDDDKRRNHRPASWLAEHGLPEPMWFVDREIVEVVRTVYADDVRWYEAQPHTRLLGE